MKKSFRPFLIPILLSLFFSFIIFFKLGTTTLESWDEAWYGAISKEIVKSNDWLDTKFNGKAFYDHPPMGFWLIAISYKIFGFSEFSTRLPSALLGLFSIILIYQISLILFKEKSVGVVSSLILSSSVWYLLRIRSGNLDSILIFFYLLTIYLSIKSEKNYKLFPLTTLAFAGLLLSKTLVGLSAVVLIFFWNYKNIFCLKNIKITLFSFVSFLILFSPWYIFHYLNYSDFINRHILEIGLRSSNKMSLLNLKINEPLFYIHMGIRKWYYLWLIAFSFLIISLKFVKKNYLFLFIWLFIIFFPFLTSEKTELWHLIPVYLPIAIIISIGFYKTIFTFISLFKRYKLNIKLITNIIFISFFSILFFIQIINLKQEVYPGDRWISDQVKISESLKKYNKKIYFNDDFFPLAVYYSEKNIETSGDIKEVFERGETNFVAIIRNWVLKDLDEHNLKYKVLEQNNTFAIISQEI